MLLGRLLQVALVNLGHCALVKYNLTLHSDTRSPDGFSREVFLINGQQPGPLIEANEGDELEIFVQNNLSVENSIHWHGILQSGTPYMDGLPGVSQIPISAGGNFTYRFPLGDQYGFYWYHSHFRAYYNDGLRGSLLIHPSPNRAAPFSDISSDPEQLLHLAQAQFNPHNVMLSDWIHELSDVTYARYNKTGACPFCIDSVLIQGKARIECLPENVLAAGPQLVDAMIEMSSGARERQAETPISMSMTTEDTTRTMAASSASASATPIVMQSLSPRGCTPYTMFRDGFNISSQPIDKCTNTTSDMSVFAVDLRTQWVGLNFVNAGAVSALSVSIDSHSMWIYAVDGIYVNPREYMVLNINIGERYQVFVKPIPQGTGNYFIRVATYPTGDMQQVLQSKAILSYDRLSAYTKDINVTQIESQIWMLLNGSATNGAKMSDASALTPYEEKGTFLAPRRTADTTFNFNIAQTDMVTWVIDREPYQDPAIPIIKDNESDAWTSITTNQVAVGSVVDIIMQVAKLSMDQMGHAIHLHGHKFWVLGSGKGLFPYSNTSVTSIGLLNFDAPPYRDVALLPQSGWLVLRYIADNPGAWMLHCHMQWHMLSGMAVVIAEGEKQLPGILEKAGAAATGGSSPEKSSSQSKFRDLVMAYISKMSLIAALMLMWLV